MATYTLMYKRKGSGRLQYFSIEADSMDEAARVAPRSRLLTARTREHVYQLYGISCADGSSAYKKEKPVGIEKELIARSAHALRCKLLTTPNERELLEDLDGYLKWH